MFAHIYIDVGACVYVSFCDGFFFLSFWDDVVVIREDADEDTPETTAAAVFNEKVLERADVDTQHGEAIIEFEDLFVVVPRGKLNCELHKNYIHFYGVNSSQDFNIQVNICTYTLKVPDHVYKTRIAVVINKICNIHHAVLKYIEGLRTASYGARSLRQHRSGSTHSARPDVLSPCSAEIPYR